MVLLYCFLFCLKVWSFLRCLIEDAGKVPQFVNLEDKGEKVYCFECQLYKPERAHHCAVCNKCSLGMDHHCPWVNNCIGLNNRKFFVLLVGYSWASTVFVLVFTSFDLLTGLKWQLAAFRKSGVGSF